MLSSFVLDVHCGGGATLASIRARFGLNGDGDGAAPGLISEALESGKIVLVDSGASEKELRYWPHWAVE